MLDYGQNKPENICFCVFYKWINSNIHKSIIKIFVSGIKFVCLMTVFNVSRDHKDPTLGIWSLKKKIWLYCHLAEMSGPTTEITHMFSQSISLLFNTTIKRSLKNKTMLCSNACRVRVINILLNFCNTAKHWNNESSGNFPYLNKFCIF